MRERGTELRLLVVPRLPFLVACVLTTLVACEPPDPALIPDERLQAELGLTIDDRVHTIEVRTGITEEATPDSLMVEPGDLVQFVSIDWLVHEIRFELDSLDVEARGFMEGAGQDASPPLLERDARFVLTFQEAPPGRYPYRLSGNRAAGSGVIIVASPEGR